MKRLLFPLIVLLFGCAALHAEYREWVSNVGTKVRAEAKGFDGQYVILETSPGQFIQVDIADLSGPDAQYVLDSFQMETKTREVPADDSDSLFGGSASSDDPVEMLRQAPPVVLALFALGSLLSFLASLILLVKAFRTSILWGIGSLLIPGCLLLFAILHLETSKRPLQFWVIGFLLILGGLFLNLPADFQF